MMWFAEKTSFSLMWQESSKWRRKGESRWWSPCTVLRNLFRSWCEFIPYLLATLREKTMIREPIYLTLNNHNGLWNIRQDCQLVHSGPLTNERISFKMSRPENFSCIVQLFVSKMSDIESDSRQGNICCSGPNYLQYIHHHWYFSFVIISTLRQFTLNTSTRGFLKSVQNC